MKVKADTLVLFGGALVLAVVAATSIATLSIFMLGGGLTGGCSKEPFSQLASEDNAYDATLLRVNCGATTGFAYWLMLGPINVYKDQVAVYSESAPELYWIGRELHVVAHGAKRFKHKTKWRDVTVIYDDGDAIDATASTPYGPASAPASRTHP